MTASSRTQASPTSSSSEAELYALGMAVQDSLYLKSLLQEMQLLQLAKPFKLTVFTDSSNGKALASKLGLTRKSKHVQLTYLFRKDLSTNGQLHLRTIQAGKNPAIMLTRHLSASHLHKLLPKLGVTTRAADSGALFSVLNLEVLASPSEQPSSFFIGMMAEQPVTAQLAESPVSLRPALSRSLPGHSQAAAKKLPTSQRMFARSGFSGYFLCPVVLPCCANCVVDNFVSFQLYGLSLSIMSILMELYRVIAVIRVTRALLTTSLPRAFRTLSSSLGSQLSTSLHSSMLSPTPRLSASSTTTLYTAALCTHSWGTNLCSIFLSIFLGWVILACHCKSLSLSANLAQTSSASLQQPA